MMPKKIKRPTSFHWGSYYAETQDDNLVALKPYELDKDPSSIANGLVDSVDDNLRIKFPHVRRGYLREIRRELSNSKLSLAGKRVRGKRGSDTFVQITWDEAFEIVAFELNRVKKKYKNKAFFNFIDCRLPVNITFNHTVNKIVEKIGRYDGYVYFDSGVNIGEDKHYLKEIDDRFSTCTAKIHN